MEKGKKPVAAYEAAAAAIRAKTERLRALRLAKEASEPNASSAPSPAHSAPAKKRAGKAMPSSATLSDWLQDQERGGRRT
jgi:hypothetical protein